MEVVESKKITTKFGNKVNLVIRAGSMTARNYIWGGMKGGSILKVQGFFYHSHSSRLGFWTFFTILIAQGWFWTGFSLKVYILRLFLLRHKYFDILTRQKTYIKCINYYSQPFKGC